MESLQIRERAQGLVEYGLIIALVAVLAIAGLIIFGPAVSALLRVRSNTSGQWSVVSDL